MVDRSSDRAARHAVAIVTAGSVGVGRRLAGGLASRGYAVVVVYLHDPDAADATVAEILAANGAAVAVRADITDELDVERLFDETIAAFGAVDVVAHTSSGDPSIVDRWAARRLRQGGAVVSVSSADATDLAALLDGLPSPSGA